jgi:hypothetical protein
MSTLFVVILIVAILIAAGLAWYGWQRSRTKTLRARYGPEYDHALGEYGGNRQKAERVLAARKERVEKIPIRSLSELERDQFTEQWHRVQSQFVDDPPGSIREADKLVCGVMEARGYPMSDFEHRAEDLSVDHPRVVRNYRAAHDIAQRLEENQATTEDLRQAVVYYRDLFDELLEAHVTEVRR